jgi:hypothetical protein
MGIVIDILKRDQRFEWFNEQEAAEIVRRYMEVKEIEHSGHSLVQSLLESMAAEIAVTAFTQFGVTTRLPKMLIGAKIPVASISFFAATLFADTSPWTKPDFLSRVQSRIQDVRWGDLMLFQVDTRKIERTAPPPLSVYVTPQSNAVFRSAIETLVNDSQRLMSLYQPDVTGILQARERSEAFSDLQMARMGLWLIRVAIVAGLQSREIATQFEEVLKVRWP